MSATREEETGEVPPSDCPEELPLLGDVLRCEHKEGHTGEHRDARRGLRWWLDADRLPVVTHDAMTTALQPATPARSVNVADQGDGERKGLIELGWFGEAPGTGDTTP